MSNTIIAWTDFTFNAWMGCTKVSAGCKNCYAERMTRDRMGLDVWGPQARRQVTKTPWHKLRVFARSTREGVMGAGNPLLVFCGSLMDWAEDRPEVAGARRRMWEEIRSLPHMHFQLLTKRPENIARYLPDDWGDGYGNVWLGTSIEDMRVSGRADALRAVPARIRFISYEPALGPLDDLDISGIDWIIYGGESGPGYRREDKDWARTMRDRCRREGIAFFHKQSAAHRTEMGIELDGEMIRQFPSVTAAV